MYPALTYCQSRIHAFFLSWTDAINKCEPCTFSPEQDDSIVWIMPLQDSWPVYCVCVSTPPAWSFDLKDKRKTVFLTSVHFSVTNSTLFPNQICWCILLYSPVINTHHSVLLSCVSVWQMRARQCVAHLLTCRAVAWVRWASSYGRYVTRLWAPGTTFSLSSSASSSLPPAPCRPGWWASSWCSTSATSRRKTNSWMWTRKRKPVRRVVPHGPGVTMAMGI